MDKEIDSRDWKILYELCKDARMSRIQLAKKLRMSKNTVVSRIRKLEEKRIIKGYTTIMNQWKLGYDFHTILFNVNIPKADEAKMWKELKNNKNILVIDKMSGEWNLLIEIRTNGIEDYYNTFEKILERLGSYIESYEGHIEGEVLKFPDPFPVPISEKFNIKTKRTEGQLERIKVSEVDIKILYNLAKDASAPLYKVADEVGITVETLSKKINELKEKGIIKRYSAVVDMNELGYTTYLVMVGLKDVSKRREMASFVKKERNVVFSVFSATKPVAFLYFTTKSWKELDNFIGRAKERFKDIIPRYMLASEGIYYNLFPDWR